VTLQRVVITGGPGAGKTTLLQSLHEHGHPVGDDAARAVIRERLAAGLSPRPEPLAFASAVLAREVAAYQNAGNAATRSGVAFFDRSIVDALGLLDDATPIGAAELQAQIARHPYHRDVFMLSPWEAIYANDAERDHSFAHAGRVHRQLVRWYERCGYAIVEVPCATPEQRCAFVLEHLGLETTQRRP